MITIRLIYFAKDVNSTATPPENAEWDDYPGTIKEPCDVLAPFISFALDRTAAPRYNYAYIAAFGRYYHITDWTYSGGLWLAAMAVDVLATYKTQIGVTSQYVLRAAAEQNGSVEDTFYPGTATVSSTATGIQTPWSANVSGGWYVVGIVSGSDNAVGGISYYIFSDAGMKNFRKKLFSADIFSNLTTIDTETAKLIYDPFQYVVSCMWFPFSPPHGTELNTIQVGFVDITGIICMPMSGTPIFSNSITFTLPRHPQSAERGIYLNAEPWSKYTLWYPPFGQIPISGAIALQGDTLRCAVRVDCITGEGWLSVQTEDGVPIDHAQGQVGVPVSVVSVMSQGQAISTAISSALSSGGDVTEHSFVAQPGSIGAMFPGVMAGVEKFADIAGATSEFGNRAANTAAAIGAYFVGDISPRITGSNGSFAIYNQTAYVTATFTRAADDDNARHGRPLCKIRQLDTLPGYQQILNPHINFARTTRECMAIESYLALGYFYD